MLALAGGFGFSFAVLALPLSDLGGQAWRIPYALGALTIFLAPPIARRLRETTRYEALALRTDVLRGRVRELFDHTYGRRFVLLAIVGLLTNVFNAPSSQLMNKYLSDEHGFSGSSVALFRTVTTGLPGLLGVVLGGRLAEARGRRPVAAIALALATLTQMVFFLTGGAVLWVASALSVIMAGAGGIALGTLDAELFPTEVRSTSNAFLSVVSVTGSAIGLSAAGLLSDHVGGLGHAIALCGIGALLASVLVVPLLPESAAHNLDEISPSEATEEYRPDP
jgi:predicted MFS family arabinose efflux permease